MIEVTEESGLAGGNYKRIKSMTFPIIACPEAVYFSTITFIIH